MELRSHPKSVNPLSWKYPSSTRVIQCKSHSNHTTVFTNISHSLRIILEYRRPTPSVVDECESVAPNQRRTETGAGTQSPPRTDCPGLTQGGAEFPRLGWSVHWSLSQSREGLPSPHMERLAVVFCTRADDPHEPSVLCAWQCALLPPPVAT